jgi:hypothetical protein
MLNRSLLLLGLSVSVLLASEPFSLKLTDLSDAWFVGGGMIQVPKDKCARIEVRLGKPWANEIGAEDLVADLDADARPRPDRMTGGDGHLLILKTRETLGLLTKPEHHLEVSANGKNPPRAEWTIVRWDKAYIQATVVGSQGVPLDIRLSQPPGGVVMGRTKDANVRFAGEVVGSLDARLTINGQEVKRLAAKSGFQFDQQIPIAADAKEIAVIANDGSAGDSTTMMLRVIR